MILFATKMTKKSGNSSKNRSKAYIYPGIRIYRKPLYSAVRWELVQALNFDLVECPNCADGQRSPLAVFCLSEDKKSVWMYAMNGKHMVSTTRHWSQTQTDRIELVPSSFMAKIPLDSNEEPKFYVAESNGLYVDVAMHMSKAYKILLCQNCCKTELKQASDDHLDLTIAHIKNNLTEIIRAYPPPFYVSPNFIRQAIIEIDHADKIFDIPLTIPKYFPTDVGPERNYLVASSKNGFHYWEMTREEVPIYVRSIQEVVVEGGHKSIRVRYEEYRPDVGYGMPDFSSCSYKRLYITDSKSYMLLIFEDDEYGFGGFEEVDASDPSTLIQIYELLFEEDNQYRYKLYHSIKFDRILELQSNIVFQKNLLIFMEPHAVTIAFMRAFSFDEMAFINAQKCRTSEDEADDEDEYLPEHICLNGFTEEEFRTKICKNFNGMIKLPFYE